MGKCMSKDHMQDKLIQHISSPVRTDNGVGFALGRLSSSHQTRWVKYEDVLPSEQVKPVVSEGQVIMTRSGSRSYGLTYPQGHLVSCVAFVSGGPLGESECTCGQRRPSESSMLPPTANSPAQEKLTAAVPKTPVAKSNTNRDAPELDVENAGVRPAKPSFNSTNKNRPALRETNVNVNVPLEVPSSKPDKVMKGTYATVGSENEPPRRASSRRPPWSSASEEFPAVNSPPATQSPVQRLSNKTADCSDEVLKSPVLVEKISSAPTNVMSPSLGSSLQSILSAISDPDSSSLVEEMISKANAAQSRCTDLEKADPAESKASHTPLSDESDTESSLGDIDPDTPSSKTVSRQSFDQSEDDAPGHTPVTARSVRTRLPIDSEFRKEEKPLHWRASALYTNCLFEESPAKNAVKSAERRFSGGGTQFTISHDAAIGQERCSETSFPGTAASEPTQEVLQPDSTDIGLDLKRKSVDEMVSPAASTSPLKRVKSLTERSVSSDTLVPGVDSTFDRELSSSALVDNMTTPAKDGAFNSYSEISPEVKAFLQSSSKVVLSLTPDGTGDCENTVKQHPSVTDSLTSSSFREIFSSSSLAAVLELEALLVTSDVRRMSGHGVEGLQIVGSELTELFSNNVRPSTAGSSKVEAGHSSRFELKLSDLNVNPDTSRPRSEHPFELLSPRSLNSGGEFVPVVPHNQEESLELETPSSGKTTPQAPQDAGDNQREEGNSTLSYRSSNSPLPLSFPITTWGRRTPVSTTPQPFVDHSLHTAVSLEDFQFLLDTAEGDEEKRGEKGGSPGARTGNTLASFGRSILQKLRDSLPTTPVSSLPSTPKLSASSTPLLEGYLKAFTPQRTGPHANSVALSPEEIAEIWGAFEQIHLT